jgi:hypothetical protein
MIRYYHDIEQGSEEWHALRCGIPTASEIRLMITQTLKPASNDKERAHLFELLGQRITQLHRAEIHRAGRHVAAATKTKSRRASRYSENFAPVDSCGFITNDDHGFVIGYSPDGLVGNEGLIECKSRRQKFQVETILADKVPDEYMLQIQTGLLVTGREWLDFVSYCAGLPMFIKRVFPDEKYQDAIIAAATDFERRLQEAQQKYAAWLDRQPVVITTVRTIQEEITC